MQFFLWLALLIVICVAVFAIQNATLPLVAMRFLVWKGEISPVYAVLASLAAGLLIMLFIWAPIVVKGSFGRRKLRKEVETLKKAARTALEKAEAQEKGKGEMPAK